MRVLLWEALTPVQKAHDRFPLKPLTAGAQTAEPKVGCLTGHLILLVSGYPKRITAVNGVTFKSFYFLNFYLV